MTDSKDEKKKWTWREILTYGLLAISALLVLGGIGWYVFTSGKKVTFDTPVSITVPITRKLK